MSAPATTSAAPAQPSHREILEVLAGLLSALFVALISVTIVSTALPTIIGKLDGNQTQYTWVVTASLLAMTVTGPIWSKLADLFDKKVLVQASIVAFTLGSAAAGAVQNVPELLGARALQGLGMGGLIALAQAILGSIIPPRERGRYTGYMAATMAVATVSGPLLGGVIVDNFGWRWCFWVAVPFAVVGLVLLQRYLHVPTIRREVKIDVGGALFITIAAALPLIWVSFAGSSYPWLSAQTGWLLGGALVALAVAVVIERRHSEPLVPPRIIRDKVTTLAIIGSIAVGVAQFGASVFLGQYFQVARGHTPTESGLLMMPLILGSMIGSAGSGAFITRTGKWKGIMLGGSGLLIAGLALMGPTNHTTPIWQLNVLMVLIGLGTGSLMQNLVLVVQNTVDVTDIGAASGVVTFFRSLGGTIGIAVLGAVLANNVSDRITTGLAAQGIHPTASGSTGTLDLAALPPAVVTVVRTAYADATGRIFLIAGLLTVLTLLAVAVMPRTELRTTIRKQPEAEVGGSADRVPTSGAATQRDERDADDAGEPVGATA
ncbi:MAG TPA: MDR family MFS transporter [Marmoricola sp.]